VGNSYTRPEPEDVAPFKDGADTLGGAYIGPKTKRHMTIVGGIARTREATISAEAAASCREDATPDGEGAAVLPEPGAGPP
jgi:hypothetical protein